MTNEEIIRELYTDDGHQIAISDEETLTLRYVGTNKLSVSTNLKADEIGGAFELTGITPEQIVVMKKSGWRKLVDAVKSAVKAVGEFVDAVVDAVSFPLGGLTCRPTVSFDFDDFTGSIGIKCEG